MTSKFVGLAADVSKPFRVDIVHPDTDEAILDTEGKAAFIDVLSTDSEAGREFDRDNRVKARRQAMKSRKGIPDDADMLEENIAKMAKLTKAWHLVDLSGNIIDVPCNEQNARELYSEAGLNWLWVQVWVAASTASNFMKSSPKS